MQGMLVGEWLNFLATAQPAVSWPAPPPDVLREAMEWLNATAPGPVSPSNDFWSGCGFGSTPR